MKIVELKAENFKRLKAVDIQVTEKEGVIELSGKNGAGKSSVLDAIWAAVGGKKVSPEEPVRHHELEATVRLDLGKLIVERRWEETGDSSIRVLAKVENGYTKLSSPQAVLDELVNLVSFDPHRFLYMRSEDQAKMVAEFAGVDIEKRATERKGIYDLRRDENRDLKRLEAEADVLIKEAPLKQPPAVADVLLIKEEIADLEKKLLSLRRCQEENYSKQKERLLWERKENKVKERDEKREECEALTERIEAYDEETRKLIRDADIGIPELYITADGKEVIYNSVPFAQASQAERLRVSIGLAIASNPQLRVIQVRDGSLLDSESLAVCRELASKHDFQIWIERVDETGEVGIVIEDGEVKKDNREVKE